MRTFLVLAFVVAACSPAPTPTSVEPSRTVPSPPGSPTPRPPAPSPSPATSVDLPAPYDRIAWAHVEANTVSIGVLGHLATTTRTTVDAQSVRAVGSVVLVDVRDDETEIVDADLGTTVARFRPSQLRLPRNDVPTPNGGPTLRDYAPQGLLVDPGHGYLYELDSNEDGLQLHRFALDGSNAARIARLGPDPEVELWDGGMAMGPAGEVDAVVCPPPKTAAADHRCRLYRVTPGANAPVAPRFLPANAPRLCFVTAASEHFLFGSSYIGCHADGGPPATIPYVAINLATGASTTTTETSAFQIIGAEEDEGRPLLIGNLTRTLPPFVYPPAAATLDGSIRAIPDSDPNTDDPRAWTVRGTTMGLRILEAFGPDYAACRLARTTDGTAPNCPPGSVVVVGIPRTPNGVVELPPETYGEVLPPMDNFSRWTLPPLR